VGKSTSIPHVGRLEANRPERSDEGVEMGKEQEKRKKNAQVVESELMTTRDGVRGLVGDPWA
jgi:hypothetical protein